MSGVFLNFEPSALPYQYTQIFREVADPNKTRLTMKATQIMKKKKINFVFFATFVVKL